MGSMRKGMISSSITIYKSPNEQKPREQPANDSGKQKYKFAGTAKRKNRNDKVTQRSLVPVLPKEEVSAS